MKHEVTLPRRTFSILILAVCLAWAGPLARAATLTHAYELNGSYADALGGPAMNPNGGTLGPTGYTFSYAQGPNVSGAITSDHYSIEMFFSLNEVGGYRKLIDFQNLASDAGLYSLGSSLNFFPIISGGPVFNVGEMTHLVLTRDSASSAFLGYVNGAVQFAFNDTSLLAVFNTDGNVIHVLRDEGRQGIPGENASGTLDFVRIYDSPLTATEVAALAQAVPEPATWMLLAGGCALLAGARRRL